MIFLFGEFFYLHKACDTVNHKILHVKPYFYGIRGVTNSWLRPFLENRREYVYLSGHSSSIKTVTCGVPQGSALGPLLFLLYINNLQIAYSKSAVRHFVGDNFLFPTKRLGTTESIVNHELKLLVQWLRSNKLSLNKTKTVLIIFRSPCKHLPHKPDIKITNYNSKLYSHIKYLGVLLMKCCLGIR